MDNRENRLEIEQQGDGYYLRFQGIVDIHNLPQYIQQIETTVSSNQIRSIDLRDVHYLDTASALYLQKLVDREAILTNTDAIGKTLELVDRFGSDQKIQQIRKKSFLETIGQRATKQLDFFVELLSFIGMLFVKKLSIFLSIKNFRYKEILFEIHQSAVRAIGIVALTNFLVGVVIAYQSAVQLKMYGANIFIVDMLGISILRELAPMITAIVIAGRSGSAYTAEIGAMKITEELDAMRTMGFDPFFYLVIPRIIALTISLPILIFIADISGVFGGMIIANTQLDISMALFLDRFTSVIDVKHFIIGELKGPFFAFLIATIAIYRGFMVKDDTQSIGKNTTKSVVESIFAVIVADAAFSVVFTNLGL